MLQVSVNIFYSNDKLTRETNTQTIQVTRTTENIDRMQIRCNRNKFFFRTRNSMVVCMLVYLCVGVELTHDTCYDVMEFSWFLWGCFVYFSTEHWGNSQKIEKNRIYWQFGYFVFLVFLLTKTFVQFFPHWNVEFENEMFSMNLKP